MEEPLSILPKPVDEEVGIKGENVVDTQSFHQGKCGTIQTNDSRVSWGGSTFLRQ